MSQSVATPTYEMAKKPQGLSGLTIRPFNPTDEEYEAVISIWNTVWPEWKSEIESYKYQDQQRDPARFFQRLVVEKNGRIVAYGIYCEAWWSKEPKKYHIDIVVLPEFQKQGIGTAFYDHVLAILSQQPDFNLVSADTRENQDDAIRFLTKRGFEQVMRAPVSHLDVQAFDASRYDGLIDKVRASGVEIVTVSDLQQSDADWLYKPWEMESEILIDLPYPDPITPDPFDQFKKMVDNPNFLPEAYLVALDNGRYVATSALWRNKADNKKLYTGLTGTRRSHRRRGIATALKALNIRYAQAAGVAIIETDNEENNPMYQINLQLGFKPQPAILDYFLHVSPNT